MSQNASWAMQGHRWLDLLVFLIVPASVLAVIPTDNVTANCEPFRNFLSRAVVRFSASYFADNPRVNGTIIDPNAIAPPTPINLFKAFYGDLATPQKFKETILRMYYSDPGRTGAAGKASDLIVLRGNIKTYALASSYELARERFGVLLYLAITDIARNSTAWLESRCIELSIALPTENVIATELEKIRNEIGEFRFGQFLDLGSGTTLAFVIDDTGSMSGEIEAAKARAKLILDERQGSLDQAQDFVLVPFNDPTVGPVTATSNADVFKAAIDRLFANGGGDSPELALRGITLAIENSRVGSTIFVITDIDAKDIELQDVLVAQAKQKSIKIFFLLTNKFRTTMCDSWSSTGSALDRRRCSTASFKLGMDLYNYIAESTGGNTLIVAKDEIFRATEVIDSTVKQGVVDISYHLLTDATSTYRINVDSLLTEVFFQFTGGCGNVTVTFNDTRLTLQSPIRVGNLYEGKIPVNSSYGLWRVKFTANGTCSLKVTARSTMGFLKTLARRIVTSSGAAVFERFEGQPLFNNDVMILLDGYGMTPFDQVNSVSFVSRVTGVTLDLYSFADSFGKSHFRVQPRRKPTRTFMLLVEGTDLKGFKFSRIVADPIEFVDVDINCVNIENIVFRPGKKVSIPLSVRNHGLTEDTYEMGVSDTLQYIDSAGVLPSSLTVSGNGGVARAVISATPSNSSTVGTTNVITITAKSTVSNILLYKTCRMVVDPPSRPRVESFSVDTKINTRFAETKMTSVVFNDADEGRSADFYVLLPVDGLMTNFSMTIDGVTYNGQIREREQAALIFQLAQERDITAGHVATRDKSTTVFQTSVNLAPRQRAAFVLTYQEVLSRKQDKYAYEVAVRMLQPVEAFSIDISICESTALNEVNVLGFDTEQTSVPGPIKVPGVSVNKQLTTARIAYRPTVGQQSAISPFGLNGKFIMNYNLDKKKTTSEMIVSGKFFLNFLSPELDVMPKRVIFTLDVSGSMFGLKMNQLQTSMISILDQLQPTDSFTIVIFNGTFHKWSPVGVDDPLVPASPLNVIQAKVFLFGVQPRGGTDILQALQVSLNLMNEAVNNGLPGSPRGGRNESISTADYVILLTDGRSTQGIVKSESIVDGVDLLNSKKFGIHTIGFGTLVDMDTLSKIAARNSGTSTQVFVDIDANVQISNFYETISRPLLHKVAVSYPRDKVSRFSTPDLLSLFKGGEFLVTGELDPKATLSKELLTATESETKIIPVSVRGFTRKHERVLDHEIEPRTLGSCSATDSQIANFAERVHVFLLLKNLLREISATNNKTHEAELKKLALNQSLSYDFVTPGITSMIVLKPEDVKELEEVLSSRDATILGITATPSPSALPTEIIPSVPGRVLGGVLPPSLVGSRAGLGLAGVDFVDIESLMSLTTTRIPPPLTVFTSTTSTIVLPSASATATSSAPTTVPSSVPTTVPSSAPTTVLSSAPTTVPSSAPTTVPSSVPTTVTLSTSTSASTHGSRLEVLGDPHVFVDLANEITICFNWLGKAGEIYNLLHDPQSGLTLNAKLIHYIASPDDHRVPRTLVGEIGIVLEKQNITIHVNPSKAIVNYEGGNALPLPLNRRLKWHHNEVTFETKLRSNTSTLFTITIADTIQFEMIVYLPSKTGKSQSHLDFSVTKKDGLSKNTTGFLGQFQHKGSAFIKNFSATTKRAILMRRHTRTKVIRHGMYETYSNKRVDCWYVHSFEDLTGQTQESYRVSALFSLPKSTRHAPESG